MWIKQKQNKTKNQKQTLKTKTNKKYLYQSGMKVKPDKPPKWNAFASHFWLNVQSSHQHRNIMTSLSNPTPKNKINNKTQHNILDSGYDFPFFFVCMFFFRLMIHTNTNAINLIFKHNWIKRLSLNSLMKINKISNEPRKGLVFHHDQVYW